jgi:hypothetical protein
MLPRFIKHTWKPYLISVFLGSLLLAIVMSLPSSHIELFEILNYTFVILCLAIPATLILAMPIAFLTWLQLQRRNVSLSHLQASFIGFIAGSILYTVFLVCFNGVDALPDQLRFASLCGGGYGLIFSLMFSLSGGLLPSNNNPPSNQADG